MGYGRAKIGGAAAALLVVVSVLACDFTVTNPGPVRDQSLSLEASHQAMVNGAGRAVMAALGEGSDAINHTGAIVTRELRASGNVVSYGVTPEQDHGSLVMAPENDAQWNNGQRARWVSEHVVERMRETEGDGFANYELGGRALLWVGYANRLLGENMCVGIIDGGPIQSSTVYFDRAEAAFSEALQIGVTVNKTDLATAARAGRASVRLDLGKWAEAAADASAVPTSFAFQVQYSSLAGEWNAIAESVRSAPYRTTTVWTTPYEQYYLDTKDPRTAWAKNATYPYGDTPREGQNIPFYAQKKFTAQNSPINLSSGPEMRLVEAEVALRAGNWQQALNLINGLRTAAGVVLATATNADETWTALKRERGIVLWLEGRRLGDMRRWLAENAPGQFNPLEDMTGKSVCMPISLTELYTNANIPSGYTGQ